PDAKQLRSVGGTLGGMMKTNVLRNAIRIVGAATLAALLCPPAAAQWEPAFGPPISPASAALPVGTMDGPIWARYTPTTDGLGYMNGYATVGGLFPVWSVPGDALWFAEVQGHLSDAG